jgi:hypothetical protein
VVFSVNQTNEGFQIHNFYSRRDCKQSIVECPKIIPEGNCGITGMAIIYKLDSMELRQNICKANVLYKQELPGNATLISIIWASDNGSSSQQESKIECYIWCTDN